MSKQTMEELAVAEKRAVSAEKVSRPLISASEVLPS